MKRIFPAQVRRTVKVWLRFGKDLFNGTNKRFARQPGAANDLPAVISIQQSIKPQASSANKVHNISIAISKLNGVCIQPGQVLSFWHLVGSPSEKNNYQKSRSIVAGKLEAETGGGLCQLSGLIYFLSLQAGLTVQERHAHSLDIYRDEERFTPLGSDATVAYGYKDLRLRNDLPFPVQFKFTVTENLLTGLICCEGKINIKKVDFQYEHHPDHTVVHTISDEIKISTNSYRLMK